jgi:MFS family permease
MHSRSKQKILLLTLICSLPTTFFLYGEPFYAQGQFHWGPGAIGLSQALSGICVAIGSTVGGKVAHRHGPRLSVAIGLAGCFLGALVGFTLVGVYGSPVLAVALAFISFMQAMMWPGLEAALVYAEPSSRIQNLVGFYNITWSLGTATAFLAVTPFMHLFGLRTLFATPAIVYGLDLLVLSLLLPKSLPPIEEPIVDETPHGIGEHADIHQYRAGFRLLGWLANPFSYVAVMAIVTYSPFIREHLHLSFAAASVWCGLYFYVRALSFEILRRWPGWHYRWPLLCGVFGLVMVSFLAIVCAPNLPVLLVAQVVFGLSIGLTYQSSLFYSMAGSDAQGEHGGIHEAFIGLGNMSGPLLAYIGTRVWPDNRIAPLALVMGAMSIGLCSMLAVGLRVLQPLRVQPPAE